MKNSRTDDNIFVLNTLVTNYTKIKKKNLFVTKTMTSMYNNCNYCIKKDNTISTVNQFNLAAIKVSVLKAVNIRH